jgi:acyl-coenzyme A synthetase/AMP-(fatty) acid ligase
MDTQAAVAEDFDCTVLGLLGCTEFAGLAVSGRVGDPCWGSVGRPLAYVEAAIVDEADEPVGPGEHGEPLLRTTEPAARFARYHGRPHYTVEATRDGGSTRATSATATPRVSFTSSASKPQAQR